MGMSIYDCDGRDGPQAERRTYSVEEAGRLLGLSRNTAYARATDGTLPTIRLGRRLLVPRVAFDRLLEAGRLA
jgi:excisionase family DNA binding protein